MRDAFQSKQGMHDVGMTDVLNTLPLRQEDLSASANTADEDSKMDTKITDREEARSQLSIRQPWERENANDITFDIENLEAHNTTTIADAPLRDTPTGDTRSKADPPER
jgi:Tfp pilus assembly major pilin PilA